MEMPGIVALAILFSIYAVGELIAQKTKAVFSTVLGIALILLAGFWSGVLPRTLIEDAQISGFGNLIAGVLIVSLGTTIDFPELKRQWKVVVISLCCVICAVGAIILAGSPLMGSELAVSGAPIFAGGSAATLIMTTALKEKGLEYAGTFCIALYVTQKFIGVPIASLLLRRTARQFRDIPELVEEYSRQESPREGGKSAGPLALPAQFAKPSVYLAKLGIVAVIAYYAAKLTGGKVHYFVMCLLMGALFFSRLSGEGDSRKDQFQRAHHLFRDDPHFLQSGDHNAAAGSLGAAGSGAHGAAGRRRDGRRGLRPRKAAECSVRSRGIAGHQLHLRLPHHDAHPAGGIRGSWPERKGKGRHFELSAAEDADSRFCHRYDRLRADRRFRSKYAVRRTTLWNRFTNRSAATSTNSVCP